MLDWLYAIVMCFCVLVGDFEGVQKNPANGQLELRVISQSQETEIGNYYYQEMIRQSGGAYTRDESLNRYVNAIGQKLAAASDRPDLNFEFTVVDNDEPNAWCLPGGKIGINLGLIRRLESEAALAAVIAHEIGHACARHPAKGSEKLLLDPLSSALFSSGGIFAGLRYSRQDEFEADYLSLRYLYRAGYLVAAAADVQKLLVSWAHPGAQRSLTNYFSSHPPSWKRLQRVNREIKKYPSHGYEGKESHKAAVRGY